MRKNYTRRQVVQARIQIDEFQEAVILIRFSRRGEDDFLIIFGSSSRELGGLVCVRKQCPIGSKPNSGG